MPIPAKTLTKQSFQGITLNRFLNLFSGNRKTDARVVPGFRTHQDSDAGIVYAEVLLKNLLEIDGTG